MYWLKSLLSLVNKLLFKKEERIKTDFTSEELISLLSSVTVKVNEKEGGLDLEKVSGIKPKFVGLVKPSFFCVSKKVSHPQSFLPRLTGRIKSQNDITLLELTYQLFPLTRFFFFVFILLNLILQIVFLSKDFSLLFLLVPIGVIFLTYSVALANFKLHCRDIKKVLKEELYL